MADILVPNPLISRCHTWVTTVHTLRMLKKFYMTLPVRTYQRTWQNPLPCQVDSLTVGQLHGDWKARGPGPSGGENPAIHSHRPTVNCLCPLFTESALVSSILSHQTLQWHNVQETILPPSSLKSGEIKQHVCGEELEGIRTLNFVETALSAIEMTGRHWSVGAGEPQPTFQTCCILVQWPWTVA